MKIFDTLAQQYSKPTVDLEVSRHLAVPALLSYIQWKMEDDHTYHNMLKGM